MDAASPAAASSWDCLSDEVFFADTVFPRVLSTCAGCHNESGASHDTRFVLLPDNTPANAPENLARLSQAAELTQDGAPLLLLKATNIAEHGGGERLKKGSEEYAILKAMIQRFTEPPSCHQIAETTPPPMVTLAAFSSDDSLRYLNKLAPLLVERFVTDGEAQPLLARRGSAIPEVLRTLASDPKLEHAARRLVEKLLSASGERDGIDFSLPGNLAAHLVREQRPWNELLTSNTCYDRSDRATPCDSGAPFSAGVLTTRAFLAGRASRFNLTRSSTLINAFACYTYPLPDDVEPRIEKTRLITMFQAMTPEDQTDARAASGFGNGHGCYQCHGQFSLHAQLFVKFDRAGKYQANATGLQDPAGELGNSAGLLMASHLNTASEAASERSEIFGQPVSHLGEAGAVVAKSPAFVPCAARKLLDAVVGTDAATTIDPLLLQTIAAAAKQRARGGEPTFADIVVATFSQPVVVQSVLKGEANE